MHFQDLLLFIYLEAGNRTEYHLNTTSIWCIRMKMYCLESYWTFSRCSGIARMHVQTKAQGIYLTFNSRLGLVLLFLLICIAIPQLSEMI